MYNDDQSDYHNMFVVFWHNNLQKQSDNYELIF